MAQYTQEQRQRYKYVRSMAQYPQEQRRRNKYVRSMAQYPLYQRKNILGLLILRFTKKVSMIRKYHNHKLQTNPWHHEEEPHYHEALGRQTK